MWEIPFYLNLVPIIVIATTLFFSVKLKKYYLGPLIIFVLLNLPTIILPFYLNVGRGGLFGWSVFYTIIAGVISFYTWYVRRKNIE